MKHCRSIWPKLALLAASLGVAMPLSAHHSFAMFDKDKVLTLKGSVSRVEWKNPHAYFYVDVVDDQGGVKTYAFECASPNELTRRGWKKNDFKVGDKISVEYFPLRDPTRTGGTVFAFTLANGTVLKAN